MSRKMPVGADPRNIGKVVTIQMFRRESEGSDKLDSESLEKHVGILQSYHNNKDGFMFRFVGGERIFALHKKHYVEIHAPETKVY